MALPTDSYKVYNKTILTEIDKNILVDLYQPIIGYKALALYYTLLNDLDKKNFITEDYTHHHLLSSMQVSMSDIKMAREKLEAVGLIETFEKKEEVTKFIYILYAPLSAKDFLNHPILNVVLFNNIGKNEYDKIVKNYKLPKVTLKDYSNVSKKFDEVFKSVPVNSYFSNDEIISNTKNGINFKDSIDFNLLISGIDSKIINEKALNKEVKLLINSLSFLYDIDLNSMSNLIRTSLNEKGMIDKELLRKSARSFYQFENSGKLPTLIHKSSRAKKINNSGNDLSNKEKMINIFESTNPYNFLKSKYKGGKVILRDMKLIEELLIDLKLEPACINVLIDYALRVNNQKLNKTYVETIASQWKRLGIKTAEEAMNACIKEYKKSKDKTKKEVKVKEVKTPDWFNMNIEKKKIKKEDETELLNLIKKYE